MCRAERLIVDLGCGDGRAVLAAAAAEPGSFVIGIDAAAASMAEASRRAAKSPNKGGLPNALFLAAGAEAIDPILDASADTVTVLFPWGSLLLGALGLEATVAKAIARIAKPGGRVSMFVSVTSRDGVPGVPCLDQAAITALADRWLALGLSLVEAHLASRAELRTVGSSWARRLAAGTDREAWQIELVRRCDDGR